MNIFIDNKPFLLEGGSTGGSTGDFLAQKLGKTAPHEALALMLNGKMVDLTTPIKEGDHLSFVHFDSELGRDIFWHTSAHVLAQAIKRLYPSAKPTIGPPIEKGFYYDFADLSISEEDFARIEEEVDNILAANFASKRVEFSSKQEAKEAFKDNAFKVEMIDGFDEGSPLSGYVQGEFFDLCRGPHLPKLGKIKAFKLMKTSGAYWRGDAKNQMLTRIYGISFPDPAKMKEYLRQLEEAKKRDHKILGPKLDLFLLREEAPGMPFILPKGMHVWNSLITLLRELLQERGYIEIKTPTMMTKDLWEKSGHWENYRQNMFTSEVEKHDFAIKPMNCPGCMLYWLSKSHSYRDLPLRVAEIGNVFRNEFSGALSGLFRVRSFHQDDAHLFMRPCDIESEILRILDLAHHLYGIFGLEAALELSTRPKEKTIGTDEEWKLATEGLQKALDRSKKPYVVKEGEGAFYGPKIDFHVKDALGRTWQCGTVQLDMALPERFDLEYIDADGERKRPVMIHRALFGSIERFFGILIENFSGRFPLWMSPTPIRIVTVADRHMPFAEELQQKFRKAGFDAEIDPSGESLGKKIRAAQLAQANYILTLGDQEVEHKTLNLRTRDNVVHGELNPDHFLAMILEEKRSRALLSPFKGEEKTQSEIKK